MGVRALKPLGRYGKDEMTAHGFRAVFSTLANESGLWHPDAIERALAHVEKNEVRRAYPGWALPPGPHRIIRCIPRTAGRRADSGGRRNGSKTETVMATHKRAPDRSTRGKLSSPGRPKAAHREQHVAFWKLISKGLSSQDAAVQVAASAPALRQAPQKHLADSACGTVCAPLRVRQRI